MDKSAHLLRDLFFYDYRLYRFVSFCIFRGVSGGCLNRVRSFLKCLIVFPTGNMILSPADYAGVEFTGVMHYQTFEISGNQLIYRAYDLDGKMRDELLIEKQEDPQEILPSGSGLFPLTRNRYGILT